MSRDGEPVEILLVDDHQGDIRLTEETLNDVGITSNLHVARTGADALDFLHQREEYGSAPCPDLVLLDIKLPDMDGPTVLKEIKTIPTLKSIPVAILSGSDPNLLIEEPYEQYADEYLRKPIDADEFLSLV